MSFAPIRTFDTEKEAQAYSLALEEHKVFPQGTLAIFIEENGKYTVNVD